MVVGGGVWYVFGWKMIVTCKNCTSQYSRFGMVFDLEFFNDEYTCVGEIFDFGLGQCCWRRVRKGFFFEGGGGVTS